MAVAPVDGIATLGRGMPREDLFAFLRRTDGAVRRERYLQLLGAANAYKEGDAAIAVAAADDAQRLAARQLLAGTRLADIDAHPVIEDTLQQLLTDSRDVVAAAESASWTLAELCEQLLHAPADRVAAIARGLSSDVIGCVVKLLSNDELVQVASKLHHPLPNSQVGAEGYLGARVQPNSPTDHADDIRWQVFDAFAYGVGDVLLGTNPVSSEPADVAGVEAVLKELLDTFGLTDTLPHCVLAHIDVQAEVERAHPGDTALWFQSLAGSDAANRTFDVTVEKMLAHAARRDGRYGLYFETGQGADFTNGHAQGVDMVLHESRKYGFARALRLQVAAAQLRAGRTAAPWVHVNDVAGFIGPEVFRSREQLVRCCLEDLVMGKLHGLTIGLDVCATLHMDIGPDDLDWCLDQIMPAHPAYLMALPTKVDPMLGYLTTGFQDHVRLRRKFGRRIAPPMQHFFEALGVLRGDAPGEAFGDPLAVFVAYRRRKGDTRADEAIRVEGQTRMREVRARGVFLAEGHGAAPHDLRPDMAAAIGTIVRDAKQAFWATLSDDYVARIPSATPLVTRAQSRAEYILRPELGEQLSDEARRRVQSLAAQHASYTAQLVISDGLNPLAIGNPDQLLPFLEDIRARLGESGWQVAPGHLVVRGGRVRAGYEIGSLLFGGRSGRYALIHVVGERPGTGHHTMSAYISVADGAAWGTSRGVDHDTTRVVSGVSLTALAPRDGAAAVARVIGARG